MLARVQQSPAAGCRLSVRTPGIPMQIRYDVSMEDIVEFGRYHYRSSPTARKFVIRQLLWWPVLVFALLYWFRLGVPDLVERVIPAQIGAVVMLAVVPWVVSSTIKRHIKRAYSEAPFLGLIGEHKMTTEDGGLREQSSGGEHFFFRRAVYRLAESKTHVLVYVTPVSAHVIPRAKVKKGRLDDFVAEIRKHLDPSVGGQSRVPV